MASEAAPSHSHRQGNIPPPQHEETAAPNHTASCSQQTLLSRDARSWWLASQQGVRWATRRMVSPHPRAPPTTHSSAPRAPHPAVTAQCVTASSRLRMFPVSACQQRKQNQLQQKGTNSSTSAAQSIPPSSFPAPPRLLPSSSLDQFLRMQHRGCEVALECNWN